MATTKIAIIGSGNIGTDLMYKIMRSESHLEMGAMVGIDLNSDGLARASELGFDTTHCGVEGLIELPIFKELEIIFDATSAKAHEHNAKALLPYGKRLIDLTPAALGPYVVPAVNIAEHLNAPDVNMVTCGGQATIPIVAAISNVVPVAYAEIVASISSRSAGPGTRANVDEFTETTATAIEKVGGAARGKAIIILNPAEPPMIMRDTVVAAVRTCDTSQLDAIREAIDCMVDRVATYVPGYRLKQKVDITDIADDDPIETLLLPGTARPTHRVSAFLEVEGAADYLPAYAGNLDIMTSAAVQMAEQISATKVK